MRKPLKKYKEIKKKNWKSENIAFDSIERSSNCPNSFSTSTTKQKPPRVFNIHISPTKPKKGNGLRSAAVEFQNHQNKNKQPPENRTRVPEIYKRRVRSMVTCSTAVSAFGERASGEAEAVVVVVVVVVVLAL